MSVQPNALFKTSSADCTNTKVVQFQRTAGVYVYVYYIPTKLCC